MKTVLITGGAGFIGSHLAELYLSNGYRVLAIDNLSTGRMENIAHLHANPNFKFVRADIRDQLVLDRLASDSSLIVHLAAAVGVSLILESPVRGIETNIGGTEDVLRAALRYSLPVLLTSTSEVYGKGSKVPFHEDDDVVLGMTRQLRWSYAISKMADESLALAYHREYSLPVVIVRLFNTVGPRQTGSYGMVVPRLMAQAMQNQDLTVYGSGEQSRCFCDVADVIGAIFQLAECKAAHGQVYNVGATDEVTILELAQRVVRMAKSTSTIKLIPYEKAYPAGFEDMMRRIPDISKIKEQIGWGPRIKLDEILERVHTQLRTEKAT